MDGPVEVVEEVATLSRRLYEGIHPARQEYHSVYLVSATTFLGGGPLACPVIVVGSHLF